MISSWGNYRGHILILISALMFGSYGIFSRYLAGYDIFYQTYVRCFIVALVLWMIGMVRKDFKRIQRKDLGWFGVVIGFTVFTVAPITYAFRYLELGTASFLFYASFTVFTYLFGIWFFKEQMTLVKIASLILAFMGLLMVFSLKFSALLLLPMALAVVNGLASGGEVAFSKKISDKYSSVQISFWVFLIIAITHMVLSVILKEKQDIGLLTDSFFALSAFVVAAVVGMFTVVEGFKYVEPSIGALIGLLEIVFSVVFGVIFFKEVLNGYILLGGVIIIIAAALPSVSEYLEKVPKET